MKTLRLSMLAISITMIVGCHEENTINNAQQEDGSYTAKVIDGYLRNALVWLDLDGDYQRDANEPSAYSSEFGNVELDVSELGLDPTQYPLVALAQKYQTIDEDHGERINNSYLLIAPPGIRNITPLSHLVYSKQLSEGLSFEQASLEIATLMEQEDSEDLFEDYIEQQNKEMHAVARNLTTVIPDLFPISEPIVLKEDHRGFESVVLALMKYKKRKDLSSVYVDFDALELNSIANDKLIIGDSDLLSLFFEERDTDEDGITDGEDSDDDGDGILDERDDMPRNATESEDSDLDGIGDTLDIAPREPNRHAESFSLPSAIQLQSKYIAVKKLREKIELMAINHDADVGSGEKIHLVIEKIRQAEASALQDFKTQRDSDERKKAEIKPLTDLELLQQRIVSDLISKQEVEAARINSSIILLADKLLASMNNNGSELGSSQDSFDPSSELTQINPNDLKIIAAAYYETSINQYQEVITKLLNHLLDDNSKEHEWWTKQGISHVLSEVALFMGDALSQEVRDKIAARLPTELKAEKYSAEYHDLVIGMIFNGLLTNQSLLIKTALYEVESAIEVTTLDGIQPDWSFHQNGPQLYFGVYGEDFLTTALDWAYKVQGLEWEFSSEKIGILASFYLEGLRWANRNGQLDYNVIGRGIAHVKPELETPFPASQDVLSNLEKIKTLAKEKMSHDGQTNFPDVRGFKHFWRSDYTVTATDDFMFGIKMNSNRTSPTENRNGENLLGYWLGFGSTFLMQTGQEYHNIFPVMDWTKIPGVTAPEYKEAPYFGGKPMQNVEFVGAASNQRIGVSTMIMDMTIDHKERTDVTPERSERIKLVSAIGKTHAHKSWFSFEDQIVALGAGISSTHAEKLSTTINQTLLNGVVSTQNSASLANGEHKVLDSRWLHHDGVGYVFFDDSPLNASLKTQLGAWSDINKHASGEILSKDVFTLTIPHGTKPSSASYQYIVLPKRTEQEVIDYQQSMPVVVLSNTIRIQAVEDTKRKIVSAVFFSAGELNVPDGLKIKVDHPCVLILDRSGPTIQATVSTPGKSHGAVTITVIDGSELKTQRVVTPGGESHMGSSVSFDFEVGQDSSVIDKPDEKRAYMTLLPTEDLFVQGTPRDYDHYGQSGYMQVKNGVGVNDRKILIRYDLNQVNDQAYSRATLRLFVRGIENKWEFKRAIVARTVHTTDWNEVNTTYSSFPHVTRIMESPATYLGKEAEGQWVDIDVTDLVLAVQPEQKNNLVLELADLTEDYEGDYVSFATREFGYKGPQLILE